MALPLLHKWVNIATITKLVYCGRICQMHFEFSDKIVNLHITVKINKVNNFALNVIDLILCIHKHACMFILT